MHKIAQVEIRKSNSMAERIFHSLKNRHLKWQHLNTSKDVRRHVRFYIREHNDVIPMSVLSVLTPAEAHSGVDRRILAQAISTAAVKKRALRVEQNRQAVCAPCRKAPLAEDNPDPTSPVDSDRTFANSIAHPHQSPGNGNFGPWRRSAKSILGPRSVLDKA